ncbi:hypothetical protein A6V37_12215 [Paraburkholderia ginsengiterrae]|uniref:Uncharacterized protein n=1 Tax=Paraburkholderia ginsengiterrae TaxID=1462993 RepID=A0A1A9NH34_9BURK|nr:hypothetical protein A6V37_12215 [Paraburkholderia ginsengiterrae]
MRIVDGIEKYTKLHGCKPAALILHPRQLLPLNLDDVGRMERLENLRTLTSQQVTCSNGCWIASGEC